jgi:GNAT superfamily N-acetyltransferase
MTISIRAAVAGDLELIIGFIQALADYERLADELRLDPILLGRHLFGEAPKAEVLIGEIDGSPEGLALFFHNFSTFECKPGIYLEDLFVDPAARGAGLGKALLARLAQLAMERGCARLEWSVLDWNEAALGFYRSLDAKPLDAWTGQRLDGAALAKLAHGG